LLLLTTSSSKPPAPLVLTVRDVLVEVTNDDIVQQLIDDWWADM